MPQSKDVALALVEHLQSFRETLPGAEQEALDALMKNAGRSLQGIMDPAFQAELSDDDLKSVEDALRGLPGLAEGEVQAGTWTLTTTLTITASHPRIGC